jgi:hypothetical protein
VTPGAVQPHEALQLRSGIRVRIVGSVASVAARCSAAAAKQIAALMAHVDAASATLQDAAAASEGAKPALVRRQLETLVLVGELRQAEGGRYEAVAEPA